MPYSSPHPGPRSPLSPSSYSSSSSSASEPDLDELDLSESFVIVRDDETDVESNSTVSTALLELLSDTSSEPRHPDSLEGSLGDLRDVDNTLIAGGVSEDEDDMGLNGSYADAEATASLLTDSRATLGAAENTPLPQRPEMPSRETGSTFRFIFPEPGASFSSAGTYTDHRTPSASVADLPPSPVFSPTVETANPIISGTGNDAPFARLSEAARRTSDKTPVRGVDEGWLKDARTWAPTTPGPVEIMMPSWEKGQYDLSTDIALNMPVPSVQAVGSALPQAEMSAQGGAEEKQLSFPVDERQLQLKRALRAVVAAGAGHAGNRWGLLAFASCALAILSAFGPGATYLNKSTKPYSAYNTSSTGATHPPSSQSCIALDEVFATPEPVPATTSSTHAARSLATQLIPDFQSIRDAISTFTSGPSRDERPASGDTDSVVGELAANKQSCCSGSAESSSVALTAPVATKGALSVFDDTGYKVWMRAMANKVVRPSDPIVPPAPSEPATKPPCNCTSTPASDLHNRYDYLLQRTRDYALSTTSAFAQLYHPMMLHLDHELREISRFVSYLAERNITQSTLRRLDSARTGAKELRRRLAQVSERHRGVHTAQLEYVTQVARKVWASLAEVKNRRREVKEEFTRVIVHGVQEGYEKIGEKVEEVKIEGEKKVRKAKKGLDRLIKPRVVDEVTAVEGGDVVAVAVSADKAVAERRRRGFRQRFNRNGRRMREQRAARRQRDRDGSGDAQTDNGVARHGADGAASGSSGPTSDQGWTRWRRLLDAAHHGAIQVVLANAA